MSPLRISRWPLWLQLISAMTGASVAVALVAGQIMRAIETDYLRDELRRESLRTSQALTLALADTIASGSTGELEAIVSRTHRDDAHIHSLALLGGAGQTVSRWVGDAQAMPGSVFYYSVPAEIPGSGQGQLVVSWNVAGLMGNIQRHVARLSVNVFVTVGLLGGLLVLLVHFLVMRPVDALRGGLDALSRGETDTRVRLSRLAAAELDRLGRSLGELGRHQRELRETQDSLEQARAAAEAASEAKGRFLAVMSHEIRTPINGVIGSLELLHDEKLGPSERSLVANAQRAADSLLEVINEILDFSRIESGRLALEDVEYPLEAQVNDVAGGMAGLVDQQRVELVVDFDGELPARVRGDPLRLRQVITNLLGNAAKFTAAGAIVLRVSHGEGNCMRVEVRDTGVGIAADQLEHLFQPFTQADISTTRHFGGTGLGLSICKQLVEMMGGHMGVESTLGEGSCFWFELPLVSVEPALRFEAPGLSGQRVVLLEDDHRAHAALDGYLRAFGLEVVAVATFGEAMAALEGEARDARFVVVDAPVADATDKLRALRSRPSDAGTPPRRLALLLPPGARVPEDAAVDACVLKPVKRTELFQALTGAGQPEEAGTVAEPALAASMDDGKILLVDDNPMNQQVAAAMLKRLGLSVDTAASGEEALRLIEDERYRVVLMDEQMPGMDGLEATRRIRAREGGEDWIPVVALTANADKEAEERCLAAGMDAFLAKPVRRKALRAVLSRWLPELLEGTDATTPSA